MVYQMPGTNVVQPVQFGATYKEGKAIEKIAKAEEKKDGNKRLAATAACVAAAAIAGINLAKKGKLGKAAQEFMGGAANNAKLSNQVGQQIADEAAQAAQKGANEVAQAAGRAVQKGAFEAASQEYGEACIKAARECDAFSKQITDIQQQIDNLTRIDRVANKAQIDDLTHKLQGVQKQYGNALVEWHKTNPQKLSEMNDKLAAAYRQQHSRANGLANELAQAKKDLKGARTKNTNLGKANESLKAQNATLQGQVDAYKNMPPQGGVRTFSSKYTVNNIQYPTPDEMSPADFIQKVKSDLAGLKGRGLFGFGKKKAQAKHIQDLKRYYHQEADKFFKPNARQQSDEYIKLMAYVNALKDFC